MRRWPLNGNKMKYNKKKLSHRPFLVVTAKFLPGNGAKTHTKGWAETAGWNIAEEVAIVDRVTEKHIINSTLIIDILEAVSVKNGFRDATPEEATTHFLQKYKEQVKEAMGVWLEREAQKLAASSTLDLNAARNAVKVAALGPEVLSQVNAEAVTPVQDLNAVGGVEAKEIPAEPAAE
jgi:hypothetical protein